MPSSEFINDRAPEVLISPRRQSDKLESTASTLPPPPYDRCENGHGRSEALQEQLHFRAGRDAIMDFSAAAVDRQISDKQTT